MDEEKQIVNFDRAEKWLNNVYKSSRHAYPILDTGIHHSDSEWMKAIWKETNSFIIGADGSPRPYASFHSKAYQKVIYNYIDQLIDWIVKNDTRKQIPAYINGAEWFWPWGELDYSPMALTAFRDWLKNKYCSIEKLNAAWGSDFKSWQDAGPLPVSHCGDTYAGHISMSTDGSREFSWTSPIYEIQADSHYLLTAVCQTSGVPEGLFVAKFLWMDKTGKVLYDNGAFEGDVEAYSLNLENESSPQKEILARSPVNASKVKVSFIVFGHGKANVKDIAFRTYPNKSIIFSTSSDDFDPKKWTQAKSKDAVLEVLNSGSNSIFSFDIPKTPPSHGKTGMFSHLRPWRIGSIPLQGISKTETPHAASAAMSDGYLVPIRCGMGA
jgi:hypothetical protein